MSDLFTRVLKGPCRLVCAAVLTLSGSPLADTQDPSDWQITKPEAVDLSSEALSAIHQDIENGRYGYIGLSGSTPWQLGL